MNNIKKKKHINIEDLKFDTLYYLENGKHYDADDVLKIACKILRVDYDEITSENNFRCFE